MANFNSKAAILIMLSLLLFLNLAESRFFGVGFRKEKESSLQPVCLTVYGANEGDTCFSISQAFNLTADFFNDMNPNLDCDKIFVGQWLCINAFF